MKNSKSKKSELIKILGFNTENFEEKIIKNQPIYYFYVLLMLCSCAYYIYKLIFFNIHSNAILIIIANTVIFDFIKTKRKVFTTENYYYIYVVLASYCLINYIGSNFLNSNNLLISIILAFPIGFAYIATMKWLNDFYFNK